MDEKKDIRVSINSMSSGDSSRSDLELELPEENHELLSKDEQDGQDLEAQSPIIEPSTPAPVEYTVSTSRKLFYLGLYFLLNLAVTLSNKALLRAVSVIANDLGSHKLTNLQGIIPVAIDFRTHICYFNRMHCTSGDWTPQAVQAYCSRELGSHRILHTIHPQHCHL